MVPPPYENSLPEACSANVTGKRQSSSDDDDPEGDWNLRKRPSRDDCDLRVIRPARRQRPPLGEAWRRTNDEIHTTIDLCPVTVALVDTPSFQRLRGIKQLGTAEYAYVNATTTRFEHSLGVMELARRMVTVASDRQPCLGCTPKDVLCVKLAGLLHDVGHGPFSHVYEQFQACLSERLKRQPHLLEHYDDALPNDEYRGHETVSLRMIDQILLELGLRMDLNKMDEPLQPVGDRGVRPTDLRAAGGDHRRTANDDNDMSNVLTTRDLVFVKECIWGKPVPDYESILGRGFHGRPPHKEWLYDVVCNRHSGLDVDKIDYYARDERRAFKGAGEIDFPMIHEARVAWADCHDPHCHKCTNRRNDDQRALAPSFRGRHLMLCYPDKLIPSCVDFFKKRFELHTKVYSHKTSVGASYMICDILCAADPYFRIPVDNDHRYAAATTTAGQAKREYEGLPISRVCLDPPTYVRCRDSIIDQIANTSDDNLREARQLIRRLWSRDMYKCAICKVLNMDDPKERHLWSLSEHDILEGMLQVRGVHRDPTTGNPMQLHEDDVLVQRCNIHHGSKDRNPLLQVRFLEKGQLIGLSSLSLEDLPEAAPVRESRCLARLPRTFQENSIRVFARNPDKQSLVRHVFDQWLDELHGEIGLTEEENWPDGDRPRKAVAAMMCSQESDDEYFSDDNDRVHKGGSRLQSPQPSVRPRRDCGQVTPISQRYYDSNGST